MVPKRILIFSYAYAPLVGGAEVAVREITDRISSSEIEFDMVTARPKNTVPVEKIGNVTVYRVGGIGGLWKFLFPYIAFRKAKKLHQKKPYQGVWSIMAAYAGFATSFFKKRFPDVPFILTLQEGDPPEYIRRKVRFVRPLFRTIFKRADKIQAISSYLGIFAKEEGAKVVPSVIGNGVDVSLFSKKITVSERQALRRPYGIDDNDIVLFTASRLVTKNAVDVIMRSLVLLSPTVKLVIAGDGPERLRLESLAKEQGVANRVCFLGTVSYAELPRWYQAADIVTRPSRSEGFGNVFAEAMAAGVPVIATSVGGIPDIVIDGNTGLVCQVDDPKDLAHKIETLIADQSLRQRLVQNGLILVGEKYDWEVIAQRMKKEVFGV